MSNIEDILALFATTFTGKHTATAKERKVSINRKQNHCMQW